MCFQVRSHVAIHLSIPSIAWFCLAATATAADPGASSVLHLTNGGSVAGELRASQDPKVLRWRSPFFAQPLEFPLSAVNAVYYTVPGPQPKPQGEYCFELMGDDLLYGDVRALTENEVELDSARIGRVHLRREQIRRFYRWKGADLIYLGPNGLASWKESATTPQWRDEGGQLLTEQFGASVFGDLGIPAQAVIEVELSWKRKPDFVVAVGVDDRAVAGAFRFEVWDDDLVVIVESGRDADVASVQQVRVGEDHFHILAYLDQKHGRLILFSPSGKRLATLKINARIPPIHSGVRLTNLKGDVRLEQLRVTRWNGLPPHEIREDVSRLHRTDGSIVYGQLTTFDPESKQFTVRDGTTESRVEQEQIADVLLSPSYSVAQALTDRMAGISNPALRLAYSDGSRVSGTLAHIEDMHVTLSCAGVKEPLRLPLAGLRSLIVLRPGDGPRAALAAGRPGRLDMDGVSLKGRLVDSKEQPNAGCLVWHPDLGLSASPLLPGAAGRIIYRETPRPRPGNPVIRRSVIAGGGVILQRVVRPDGRVVIQQIVPGSGRTVPDDTLALPPSSGQRSLHLRSGDRIPCVVTGMDEKGITIKTPFSNATFVAHEKIKSVELSTTYPASGLDEAKRDRLLTLPRMQKGLPPTQLICSKNGDFLRGRVLAMDETRLKVEVRSETREIPRERIAQIIWLHTDELTSQKAASTAGDHSPGNRVQTVRADGNRLTFVAEKADHKTIWGTSEVLGACRAELAEVDQLLFGTFIEESATKLAYHVWKLHHATEPKFAQSDRGASATGGLTGLESPLVGQRAFPFKLDMLDGRRFHLADHKGRVIVLEFWASWCGPCLQAMPLVDAVVREFADRNVELVAVNLEEQMEQVKSMLERQKLKIPVAFDRDGAVAAKYAVTAIPQTVVIDRDGKVARLFVGGGEKTAESLRKALHELCGPKPAPEDSR
jgi:thiol-disulfide isomerase/thioredoxin